MNQDRCWLESQRLPRVGNLPSVLCSPAEPSAVASSSRGKALEPSSGFDSPENAPKLDIGVYGARGIPSTYSGYETFLSVLLPELAARGHRVTVYCRSGRVPGSGDYRGVRRVFLPAWDSKQFETLSHGLLAATVARLCRHEVVFAVNVANALPCMLAKVTGQRAVLNTDGQEWLRGKWGKAARTFFLASARLSGPATSGLISDSNGMRDIYKRMFGADSTVIPYCWTAIGVHPDPGFLESLDLKPRRYFVVAGRLNPENNIHRVAEAYLQSGAGQPLVVLGEANYDSEVTRRLRELSRSEPNIVLAGHIGNRSDFASLLSSASAYFHAHSVGGINPSLIEAMGCGARIVALNTIFNLEALGGGGSYFDDFDRELPRIIRSIETESYEAAAGYRLQAQDRARACFSLEAVADAHEALFSRVRQHHPWKRVSHETEWAEPWR